MAQIKKLSTELQPLDKLLDSSGDAGTSGQILSSTGSGTNWVSASSGTITGSGTTGYIPKWTGSSALGDSILEVNSALPNDVIIPQYIRHAGDTNTYFGFYSNDNFRIITNNNTVLTVTDAGRVGIGATSLSKKLEVVSNTTYDGIQISGSSIPTLGIIDTTNNAKFVAYVRDSDATIGMETNHPLTINTNNIERMRITSAGNVGIGTTSPSAGSKLEVIGKGSQLGSTGFYVNSSFKDDNNVGVFLCHDDTVNNTGAIAGINQLSFVTYGGTSPAWGERMKITGAGNVGIGTSSPAKKLHVRGSAPWIRIEENSAANKRLDLYVNPSTAIGIIAANQSAQQLSFQTSNIDRLRITNAGNVGIGNTSPTAPLDVLGVRVGRNWAINDRANIRLDSNGTGVPADILFGHTAAANQTSWTGVYWALSSRGTADGNKFHFYRGGGNPGGNEAVAMTIASDLKVGIGTTSPNEVLEVSGNIRASGSYKAGDTEVISSGRRFFAADGTNSAPAYSFSDRTDTGIYVDDSGSNDRLRFSVDGTSRFYIDANGITSPSNIYSGGNGQFRNYSGVWKATTGVSGNGFQFYNTADNSSAVLLSITSASSAATDSVATFSGKVKSAQTTNSDGNDILTTKSYVDGLVTGVTRYMGLWDARTSAEGGSGAGGSPDLTTSTYKVPGYYFIVSHEGTATPNGAGTEPNTWHVGDWVIWSDQATDAWQKIDNTSVLSGTGTANKVAMWNGDESLTNAPITISGNDSTFTGNINLASGNINLDNNGAAIFDNSNNNNAWYIRNGGTSSATLQFGLGTPGANIKHTFDGDGNIAFGGDVTVNGSHLTLKNGTTYAQATDYLYIGGSGLDNADAAIYLGNRGDGNSYGWRFIYKGTGSGNGNNLIIQSENATSPVDALTFNQNGVATFASNVTVSGTLSVSAADSITIADYILHSGDDSKFGFPSDDNFKIRLAGSDLFTMSTTTATFTGNVHLDSDSAQLQFGDDNDMQIFHNGANGEINIGTGDFTIDSAGDITLDAGGNDIRLFKAGAEYGKFKNDSSDLSLYSSIQDKDILFKGNDNGSTITALQLDMSDSGFAIFNYGVKAPFYTSDGGRGFKMDSVSFVSTYSEGSDANAVNDIGKTANKWRDAYFSGQLNSATISTTGTATFAGNIEVGRKITFTDASGGTNQIIGATEISLGPDASAHDATGHATVLYAGSPSTGTTNDIAGGHMWIAGGQGKGTGAGGDIIFRVAPPGSSGSTLNSMVTALTISDDKSASFTGNVSVVDNAKFEAGTGKDLKIWHDGSNTKIENYTGNLSFREFAADGDMYFQADNGTGGGNIATYFYLDGGRSDGTNLATRWNDGSIILMGSGTGWNDGAQIYHSGSNFYLNEYVGNIEITCHTTDGDIKFKSDNMSGGETEYFRVDGGAGETIFSRNTQHLDSVYAQFGAGDDLKIFHNGTDSFIINETGNLKITQGANSKDIIFECDNGSGGTAEYLRLDGGISSMLAYRDLLMANDGTNGKIKFGASQDLQIYHNGTDSYIENATGELRLISNDWALRSASSEIIGYDTTVDAVRISKNINFGDGHFLGDDGNDNLLLESSANEAVLINGNTNVKLQDGGNTKLTTTSTGISVTGVIDDRDIPCLFNSNFEDAYSTSIIVVPFNNNTESTVSTRTYNHNLTMPYAGKLTKIVMKNVSGTLSSGFTTQLFLYVNGSQQISSSEISLSGSSVTWTPISNNAFSAGDVLSFAYQKSAFSTFGGVSFGVAIELTDYDI